MWPWEPIADCDEFELAERHVLVVNVHVPECALNTVTGSDSTVASAYVLPSKQITDLQPLHAWLRMNACSTVSAHTRDMLLCDVYIRVFFGVFCNHAQRMRDWLGVQPSYDVPRFLAVSEKRLPPALDDSKTNPRIAFLPYPEGLEVAVLAMAQDSCEWSVVIVLPFDKLGDNSWKKGCARFVRAGVTVTDVVVDAPYLGAAYGMTMGDPASEPVPACNDTHSNSKFAPEECSLVRLAPSCPDNIDDIAKGWLQGRTGDGPSFDVLQFYPSLRHWQAQHVVARLKSRATLILRKDGVQLGATALLRTVAFLVEHDRESAWSAVMLNKIPDPQSERFAKVCRFLGENEPCVVCIDDASTISLAAFVGAGVGRLRMTAYVAVVDSYMPPSIANFEEIRVSPFVADQYITGVLQELSTLFPERQSALRQVRTVALHAGASVWDKHIYTFVLACLTGRCEPPHKWVQEIVQKLDEDERDLVLPIAFASAFGNSIRGLFPLSRLPRGELQYADLLRYTDGPDPHVAIVHRFVANIILDLSFGLFQTGQSEFETSRKIVNAWKDVRTRVVRKFGTEMADSVDRCILLRDSRKPNALFSRFVGLIAFPQVRQDTLQERMSILDAAFPLESSSVSCLIHRVQVLRYWAMKTHGAQIMSPNIILSALDRIQEKASPHELRLVKRFVAASYLWVAEFYGSEVADKNTLQEMAFKILGESCKNAVEKGDADKQDTTKELIFKTTLPEYSKYYAVHAEPAKSFDFSVERSISECERVEEEACVNPMLKALPETSKSCWTLPAWDVLHQGWLS